MQCTQYFCEPTLSYLSLSRVLREHAELHWVVPLNAAVQGVTKYILCERKQKRLYISATAESSRIHQQIVARYTAIKEKKVVYVLTAWLHMPAELCSEEPRSIGRTCLGMPLHGNDLNELR